MYVRIFYFLIFSALEQGPELKDSPRKHFSEIHTKEEQNNKRIEVAHVHSSDGVLLAVLRTLMGHKANICSLDFHPFGEYLASGSVDTNIKVTLHSLFFECLRFRYSSRDLEMCTCCIKLHANCFCCSCGM